MAYTRPSSVVSVYSAGMPAVFETDRFVGVGGWSAISAILPRLEHTFIRHPPFAFEQVPYLALHLIFSITIKRGRREMTAGARE